MSGREADGNWLAAPRGTEDIPRGTLVEDPESGRVGVLQDVTAYVPPWQGDQRPRPTAFVRPVGGGREWTVPPERLRPVPGGTSVP
ncbi:hypothetical protein GCM10010451_06830 [Streptomyces virens]|uniref:Uncharacterized protein n=2 Tax=Streptomyces TaxID=1883 RepID=A0A514JUE7_9ACTN|nr:MULTISPECIES: hypothetical protein [Streptomyces]MBA8943918.1 hypothetical protein [Streptomyces calvus]MBA8978264.1 hypothetical protein [Streptomyces calvus]MYS30856.1 hypothetical protein [Streptomyces sp. SID7804]QDI71005.1 hypothetical protein CD934_21655 [Streptomyces calvus]GGP57010.1 hypothetical protein GCM10010247_31940 [Streptomyces calvus]